MPSGRALVSSMSIRRDISRPRYPLSRWFCTIARVWLRSPACPSTPSATSSPTIHPDAFVHPDAVIIGDVRIGAESSIWPGAVLRGDDGDIRIGERTSIQDNCVLHTTPLWPTIVGDDCVVGHIVHLEGCTIERGCLVGNGSIVMHRVIVRTGAIVAANAVRAERRRGAVGRHRRRHPGDHQGGQGEAGGHRQRCRQLPAPHGPVPARDATDRLMLALVVDVPEFDAELASDALWGLGVVAVEERAARRPAASSCGRRSATIGRSCSTPSQASPSTGSRGSRRSTRPSPTPGATTRCPPGSTTTS